MGVKGMEIFLLAVIILVFKNVQICKCQLTQETVTIGPVKFCCLEGVNCTEISSRKELINLPDQIVELNTSISSWSEPNGPKITLSLQGSLDCFLESDSSSNLFTLSLNESSTSDKKFTIDGYFDTSVKDYSPDGYCIRSFSEKEIVVKICKSPEPDVCNGVKGTCIRKCCKSNEVYDLTNYGHDRIQCVQTSHPWIPTFYKADGKKLEKDEIGPTIEAIGFVSSHPSGSWCEQIPVVYSQRKLHNEREYRFRMLEDGTVLVRHHYYYKSWWKLLPEAFCIDGAQNFPGHNVSNYEGDERDTIIIDCSAPKLTKETAAPLIYGIFQGISSFFLLLTVLVYAILWERQNIHSWTLLGYAITILCLYGSLVFSYFHIHFSRETSQEISITCIAAGVITHFLFISTFCWMTLINYDVWWTFYKLKIKVRKAKNIGRFMLYMLFGLGVPTVIVSVGLFLDYFYSGDLDSQIIRPEYGGSKCFMNFDFAVIPYLYIPMGTLVGCNAIFFVVTVYTLHNISESTKFATNMSSHQSTTAKAKYLLFIKLFIVTGVTWTLDLLSVILAEEPSVEILVYIVDILNILQPVAIFVIFVCKAEVLRGLQQKYPSLRIQTLSTSPGTSVLAILQMERIFNAMRRKKSPSGRSMSSVVTDDTNISTSSIRSIGSHHQHSINLQMMGGRGPSTRRS